jgi:hypothetical protein
MHNLSSFIKCELKKHNSIWTYKKSCPLILSQTGYVLSKYSNNLIDNK